MSAELAVLVAGRFRVTLARDTQGPIIQPALRAQRHHLLLPLRLAAARLLLSIPKRPTGTVALPLPDQTSPRPNPRSWPTTPPPSTSTRHHATT